MLKFSPYMILIGGVDDATLDLNYNCCLIKSRGKNPQCCKFYSPIDYGVFDLTDAFKARGMVAFGPRGNPCNPCGPPSILEYPKLYAR